MSSVAVQRTELDAITIGTYTTYMPTQCAATSGNRGGLSMPSLKKTFAAADSLSSVFLSSVDTRPESHTVRFAVIRRSDSQLKWRPSGQTRLESALQDPIVVPISFEQASLAAKSGRFFLYDFFFVFPPPPQTTVAGTTSKTRFKISICLHSNAFQRSTFRRNRIKRFTINLFRHFDGSTAAAVAQSEIYYRPPSLLLVYFRF